MKKMLLGILFSGSLFAAPAFVYQAEMVKMLMNSEQVLDSFRRTAVFTSIEMHDLDVVIKGNGVDYSGGKTTHLDCQLSVKIKVDNPESWNPVYSVESISPELCTPRN